MKRRGFLKGLIGGTAALFAGRSLWSKPAPPLLPPPVLTAKKCREVAISLRAKDNFSGALEKLARELAEKMDRSIWESMR